MVGFAILLGLFVAGVYVAALYNQLVLVKHNVAKAWANTDVLLKQRNDEIPKLIAVCREYAGFEATLLARLAGAHAAAVAAQQGARVTLVGAAEAKLGEEFTRLAAVAEAWPDLKSNLQFRALQERLSGLEAAIADRREFYNESVRIHNVTIERFPASLLAGWFSFQAADLLRFRND